MRMRCYRSAGACASLHCMSLARWRKSALHVSRGRGESGARRVRACPRVGRRKRCGTRAEVSEIRGSRAQGAGRVKLVGWVGCA
jgi:hypothetical protein